MNEYELIVDNNWVSPEEYRDTIENFVPAPKDDREIDELTGLPIKKKESMEEKYHLFNVKDNSFTRSLREQFDTKGYLSPRQLECLRK